MEKPFPWMEKLSHSIVEIVKKVEVQGEKITPESVTRILNSNPSLLPMEFGDAGESATPRSSHIKFIQELEEEQEKLMELFRSTVATLSPFVHFPERSEMFRKFETLKEKLKNNGSLEEIEKALGSFKETAFQQGVSAEKTEKGIKKFLGVFQRSDSVDDLKQIVFELITAIDPLIPDLHREKWAVIREAFYGIHRLHDFASWNATFAELLSKLIAHINQEKKELDEFISELGQNLVEIEKNIIASLDHVHTSQEMSSKFNYHLDGQINDLRQSVKTVASLEDLRKMLITKLSYIRQVLEKRRQQEEEYSKELEERIHKLQRELSVINEQIKQAQSREQRLAEEILKDPLTGVANRRAYEIRMVEEWERFRRYGHVFSIAIFDIDHFKNVNDSYGHKAGDLVLREIARIMKSSLRKTDLVARYGGEEFVVILTGTDLKRAKDAAEKIRRLIEETKFVFKKQTVPITISAGVAQIEPTDKSPGDIFERADKALYAAKNRGRNRVVIFPFGDE